MNHISQLKSQVEDLKLGGEHRYETEQVQELQKLLEQEREAGEMREKEVRIVMHVHSPRICRTPLCCISVNIACSFNTKISTGVCGRFCSIYVVKCKSTKTHAVKT